MTIDIYNIAKDTRVLNKTAGASPINSQPIVIKPTDKINLTSPVFELDYDASYMTATYLYCYDYDRYYWIQQPRINTAQRLELPCSIDVRQSFSTAIRNTECTVIRSESVGKPTMYTDTKLPVYPSKKNITSIPMPENSNSFYTLALDSLHDCYLLTVVGGEASI